MKVIHVSGKRKMAIARATLRPGAGIVRVNSKLLNFVQPVIYRTRMSEPMILAGEKAKNINVDVQVHGGGISSQADATRLVIARALSEYDDSLEKEFLEYDRTLIVADVRRKESRKPNCHGKARAKRQKSYR